jgi:hypothetical protein
MAMEPRETLGTDASSIAVTGQFMVTLPLRPRNPESRTLSMPGSTPCPRANYASASATLAHPYVLSDNTFTEEEHASDMVMAGARIASPVGVSAVSLSNKLCAHVSTHVCRYLSNSDSDLCGYCQFAINNGLPCSPSTTDSPLPESPGAE